MSHSKSLQERLEKLHKRMENACLRAGRDCAEVQLLAVSKGHSAQAIEELYALGVRDFGESYVQEWLPKLEALKHLQEIRWHFIGHLQSNKAKFVVGKAVLIHSIDRLSVLEAVEKQAASKGVVQNILIEAEVDANDANKGGVSQAELGNFLQRVAASKSVRLRGYMGMGPANALDEQLAPLYKEFVAQLRKAMLTASVERELCESMVVSLGMSGDIEVAIAAGSNMVRVGTALFGERSVLG